MGWLRMKWCSVVGHRWRIEPKIDGRVCRRCREYQPTYKQVFGHVKITGSRPYDQTKHD